MKVTAKKVKALNETALAQSNLRMTEEALADAYCEMERLIQENKDLRLAEARALSDKKKAEDDLSNMKREYANVCADRDNLTASYKQLVHNYNTLQEQATDECADLREELRDREARVAELEQRITYLQDQAAVHKEEKEAFEDALRGFDEMRQEYQKELAQAHSEKRDWMQSAEQWRTKYLSLEEQKALDDQKCEETCKDCNEIYERVVDERNHLRGEVERLTTERDTAVTENTELTFENSELKDAMKVAEETIKEQRKMLETASETIQNLRRPVTPSIWDIMRMRLKEIEKHETQY